MGERGKGNMRRLKMLIVDDEIKICKLIEKLIDFEKFDIDLIGMVHDGMDAIEIIEKEKPDIIFTDIRMPGLDGLELIKRCKTLVVETRFVIISGYRHFDYALRAIKYGVDDYLLKPINKIDLNSMLKRIIESIYAEENQLKEHTEIEDELKKSMMILRKHIVNQIILKDNYAIKDEIKELKEAYQIDLSDGFFQVVNFKISGLNKKTVLNNYKAHILDQLKTLLELEFQKPCKDFMVLNKGDVIVSILNYHESEMIDEDFFYKLLDKGDQLLSCFGDVKLYIAVGSMEKEFSEVSVSLANAELLTDYQKLYPKSRILLYSKKKYQQKVSIWQESIEVALKKIIIKEDINQLKHWFFNQFFLLKESNSKQLILLRQQFEQMVQVICRVSKDVDLCPIDGDEQMYNLYQVMNETDSLEDIRDFFIEVATDYFEEMNDYRLNKEERPIQLVKAYVEKHFKEQISLDELSRVVNLNPNYLSSLFKKATDQTITNFLIEIRIDKAKELLKQTNSNISEIAYNVGYSDAKYFSKLFRRKVGIKPNEYRKFYM